MLQQFYPKVDHHYRFELNKDMNFSAAHFIPSELAGKCQNIHGHTYFVNITVAGNHLDESGFLINFKKLKDLVHDRYDHTVLNDSEEFAVDFPTTEVVAKTIYDRINDFLKSQSNKATCMQVIVRETPTSYAIYK